MTAELVHEFLPPPLGHSLRVWTVTRHDLDTGFTVPLGRWPAFVPEEALISACKYGPKADGACTYRVEAFV